ncbi:V-set and transmembrane domain containing protein 4 [Dissostichus eleginoides]|uniref:V-set and transmembrane domain containing protein 4 n=1 Tax=Dissostichus eleginoides TaxID=100907 RepID=A0AAD9FKH6_DISEL|nr:V-set and transmembrane domain containing protein 4 [Dissostichus eleginoides]
MYFSIAVLVLTKALVTEVCHGLNVTVTPGPVVMVTEKDNATLSCMLGIKKIKLYGNYTRRFTQLKYRLFEETEGEVYRLQVLNVTRTDQGFYSCRVQEIRKHRNTWRASSNGTSTTQLTVDFTLETGSSDGLWRLFAAQERLLPAPAVPPVPPQEPKGKTQDRNLAEESQYHPLNYLQCPHLIYKPKCLLLQSDPRSPEGQSIISGVLQIVVIEPRVSHDDSLTYAELELVRPRPEPPSSSSPDPTASSTDTVYAQIFFQEKQP